MEAQEALEEVEEVENRKSTCITTFVSSVSARNRLSIDGSRARCVITFVIGGALL